VASISGWSPQLAMSGQYGAAKAALIFDTERWARWWRKWDSNRRSPPGVWVWYIGVLWSKLRDHKSFARICRPTPCVRPVQRTSASSFCAAIV
jgi:hypothetical protein